MSHGSSKEDGAYKEYVMVLSKIIFYLLQDRMTLPFGGAKEPGSPRNQRSAREPSRVRIQNMDPPKRAPLY